jgi:hypothetical protein
MSWAPKHAQVVIEWEGCRAEVDEEIAPLILTLWRLGIRTYESCQHTPNDGVYVDFVTPTDAKNFFDMVYDLFFWMQWLFMDIPPPDGPSVCIEFRRSDLEKIMQRLQEKLSFR